MFKERRGGEGRRRGGGGDEEGTRRGRGGEEESSKIIFRFFFLMKVHRFKSQVTLPKPKKAQEVLDRVHRQVLNTVKK